MTSKWSWRNLVKGHDQMMLSKRASALRGRQRSARFAKQRTSRRQYNIMNVGELKFHDLDVDDTLISATGSIARDTIVAIAQGTTESQRVGRRCVVRHISWRWDIELLSTSSAALAISDVVRVILYLDKQCNNNTASVANILETADYKSFNQLATKRRFRILMDRVYDMNSHQGAGDGAVNDTGTYTVHDSLYKKCSIPIEWDNSVTTGVIASITSNNIGVLLISKNNACSFESKFRVRFSDA